MPEAPKTDQVKIALLQATTAIVGDIIQHTPEQYHVQLQDQINGIIDRVMTSLVTNYNAKIK